MLANGATYTTAVAAIGAHRRTIIKWPDRDEEFAQRWKDAIADDADKLEEEAFRRAVEGIDRSVFYQGRIVGYVKEYSDYLLIRLLQARRPEVYRARRASEVPADDDGVLEVRWKESESLEETPEGRSELAFAALRPDSGELTVRRAFKGVAQSTLCGRQRYSRRPAAL
jgi:hypothetical protein